MSFQGDVAGIGLGELLQGLARGGRDGVLTLYGERISGCLGVKGGMLYMLPAPEEDESLWRERSLRAWADDPKPLMETRRREAIARAERLETFYRMLETENMHFRFEPGAQPNARATSEGEDPWGQGMPVEYMLLEHARLSDEGGGSDLNVEFFDLPRALDPSRFPPDVRDFLAQCDGSSTLQEIADRLGWPLRQCRLHILEHYKSGAVRLAQPRELLAAGQHELASGRVGRAATRLAGWVRSSLPGPLSLGDAELFVGEWKEGRLPLVLGALSPRDGRAILRKLDRVHNDRVSALERWRKLADEHRSDLVSQLHKAALQLAATEEPDPRSFTDLLRVARNFQEQGYPARTRTLLRLASFQLPSRPQTRIELGRRMVENGLVEEGTRWLLELARELIDQADGDRALAPIRIVLKKLPDHTGAHGLLIEARALIARRKRRRWKSAIALAVVVIVSMVGLVHLGIQHKAASRMGEVRDLMANPEAALALLNEYFPEDQSESVAELRSQIIGLIREAESDELTAWQSYYQGIEEECEYGDPLLGLKRALDLKPAPTKGSSRNQPTRMDLLSVLTGRIERLQREANVSVDATIEELHAEDLLQTLLRELLALSEKHSKEPEVSAFYIRLEALNGEVQDRSRRRAQEREDRIRAETEEEQDALLNLARAHDSAGDLERAVATYEALQRTPGFDELAPHLSEEIEAVKKHWDAVVEATALAERGDHRAALDRLEEGCPRNPSEHLLPWKVESMPTGARATNRGGQSRVTPYTTSSQPGSRRELTFEMEGYETQTLILDNPQDLEVFLHRIPERVLGAEHRVQAMPVPVGDDHVIADRKGRILRLDGRSNAKWTQMLESLGGVARTPMFLPQRPGYLLVITEDGRAWLVDAANGKAEGPVDLQSPPEEGPTLTRKGVWLQLADERIAVWEDGVQPTFLDPDERFVEQGSEFGLEAEDTPDSLVFLRRHALGETTLVLPATGWKVEVRKDHYLVHDGSGRGFTARREGEWNFVAWETPKALLPLGRLWVSDGAGLRSYRPDNGPLLRYSH